MKKFVLWLIKVFKLDIVTERIVDREIIKYQYITDGTIEGDIYIDGDLKINGCLTVTGEIACYSKSK